jgi:2-hydroxy-6-oxonona-2,4-dienedioate hydrolase
MLSSEFGIVDGVRIHARVARQLARHPQPPIVLVHGLGVSSRYMIPLAVWLAHEYPVYAPDLPGFGESARPRDVYTVEELSEWLAKWMQAEGLRDAIVVGNSMGCQVTVELAIRHPELVLGCVLLGPTMDPRRPRGVRHIVRLLRDHVKEGFLLNTIAALDYLSAGVMRVAKTYGHALRHEMSERIRLVQQPTLVIRGAQDSIVPEDWAAQLAWCLPRGSLITIPGVPHATNFNAPRRVADEVVKFVDALARHRLIA